MRLELHRGTEMRSANTQIDAVLRTRDGEWAMPEARRNVPRRTEWK
jgi:hypothetical protein